MKSMIGQIELIAAEQELAGEIVFDVLTTRLEYEQGIKNGELAACIMESLMNRKAIRRVDGSILRMPITTRASRRSPEPISSSAMPGQSSKSTGTLISFLTSDLSCTERICP